ncbi:MAG: GNAT family N-acetyltransferase [Bacteroidetes bacterium]|nr:GNAT family N-acetyltransferase [Bacteroidota bacterium]MBK8362525.1 GNAT family N-acetyltransferase [Bacteroidota bacterium]MBK9412769.1 GNAT family N-acetyltransferase [Bacteroidota bacterium]MBP6427056.1 GNAT family N-acetyltransferase [Bacteroidia bacterium]
MNIQSANSDESIEKCFLVMKTLRPHLEKNSFVDIIKDMATRGYKLIFIEENGIALAASGYRFAEHLHWGKAIYIDDLTTLPEARGKGYASALLDHITSVAKENGCAQVHLDSGCNPARYDAHRLYLKHGFNITSFHFAKAVISE